MSVLRKVVAWVGFGLLLVALLFPSTAFAKGSERHNASGIKPDGCYWSTVYWDTQTASINGTAVGWYEAGIDELSANCNSATHRVYGTLVLNAGGCTSGSIAVDWWLNGVKQSGGGSGSSSIGPWGCSTTTVSWTSWSYTGWVNICVNAHATYNQVGLAPDAALCHQF